MCRDRESAGVHDGVAGRVADSAGMGHRGAVPVFGQERGVLEYADGVERVGGDSVFVLYREFEWVVARVLELVEV